MIKGITVTLIQRVDTGNRDPFNAPIYEEKRIEVNNVLVAPNTTDDIVSTMNLTGKKAEYIIAVPKGDANTWEDNRVEFFGKTWHVFTLPEEGIESMIPLQWHKKYKVERYE